MSDWFMCLSCRKVGPSHTGKAVCFNCRVKTVRLSPAEASLAMEAARLEGAASLTRDEIFSTVTERLEQEKSDG